MYFNVYALRIQQKRDKERFAVELLYMSLNFHKVPVGIQSRVGHKIVI